MHFTVCLVCCVTLLIILAFHNLCKGCMGHTVLATLSTLGPTEAVYMELHVATCMYMYFGTHTVYK